jgi:hypothetical protein
MRLNLIGVPIDKEVTHKVENFLGFWEKLRPKMTVWPGMAAPS